MYSLKQHALKLRKEGYSYGEINQSLKIPKSTLSNWFSGLILSEKATDRLKERSNIGTKVLIERNKMQTVRAWERANIARKNAIKEIENSILSERDLLLMGTALYWGEGYKKLKVKNGRSLPGHIVSITNSDPGIIRTFVLLINRQMKVPLSSFNLFLRLYDSIDEKVALKFWLKASGLPKKCFKGTTYLVSISSQRKRPYNTLPHGTVQVSINDTQKFHRVMGWIDWMRECTNKLKFIDLPE